MITIDGAEGEGGGQVLRTSLSLSLATGTPFRIDNIRGRRAKPGLLRQHLTAVHAAQTVGRARVTGAALGSASLTFEPTGIYPGEYTFSVGSAGSATLVFQTVLLPLLKTNVASRLSFEGGTHNPWAPPFDFLTNVFARAVGRMGVSFDLTLERHGFYPAGGGRFTAVVPPINGCTSLDLCQRGDVVSRRIRAMTSNLPRHIADREITKALAMLNWNADTARVETVTDALGPGNVLLVEVESEHVSEMFTGFGESGVPAEAVASHTVQEVRRYLTADVPVGIRLADQLLPLMAVGAGGSYRTMALSRHALTNIDVIQRFCSVSVEIVSEGRDIVRVTMEKK